MYMAAVCIVRLQPDTSEWPHEALYIFQKRSVGGGGGGSGVCAYTVPPPQQIASNLVTIILSFIPLQSPSIMSLSQLDALLASDNNNLHSIIL